MLTITKKENPSQINCLDSNCSVFECCNVPESQSQSSQSQSSQSQSSQSQSSQGQNPENSSEISCSSNNNEIDCIRSRCYWNVETSTCSENIERIKESDPIPIKGNMFIVNNNISSYDGLCMNTGNDDSWRKSPDNLPLVDDKDLYIMQGHNSPLKPVIADYSSLYGPTIDGDDDSPNKLFLFSNNLSSPACCPSTFTTSTGCLCTSKKAKRFYNIKR